MIIKKLKVKGFKSYIDETINFEDFSYPLSINGVNGSGKSSIIDMITTVLFNENSVIDTKTGKMDDCINKFCDKFEIELDFVLNDINYKIIRRKKLNGGQELELYINDISHTEKLKETQQKINDILKMDYDTFLDTVCIGQGKSNNFMSKKPNERKEIISQILNLDIYNNAEIKTKELRKELKKNISLIDIKLEDLLVKINEEEEIKKIIISNKEKIKDYEILFKDTDNEYKIELIEKSNYEQKLKNNKLIQDQIDKLNIKIERLNNSIKVGKTKYEQINNSIVDINLDNIKLIDKNIEKFNDEYEQLFNNNNELIINNNTIINETNNIKQKFNNIKLLNEGACEKCGQQITEKYKKEYLNELATIGKKNTSIINENKILIDKNNKQLNLLKQKINELNIEKNDINTKYNINEQNKIKLENIKDKLLDLETELNNNNEELQELLKQPLEKIEDRIFRDNELKIKLNDINSKLNNFKSTLAIFENKLIEIEKYKVDFDNLNKEKNNKLLTLEDYDDLIVAFGKSGIQALIIENILPEIENETNEILDILCDNKISVNFKTQKDNKNKTIETLDIIINDETGTRTYETYSGGERFRIDFATHIGLARFLARRSESNIEFFIIDEGLGSQDFDAIEKFVNSVNKISSLFKQIFIISHIKSVHDSFNNKILIKKDLINGSKVYKI